ncbi:hypothetical protein E1161_04290 [Saccharopolyspora aridisoli]|uniref:Uncharacterized protein n=1 Tax=Saccharopolyspora aridisoli TaxID=2530385 RepID=A0A4R4UZX1_9PSEU|nr:hypothetical protein [Saccharopolyspora aridisoli]TDC95412.1 hypothetical protein E1161_04290 [Saccharopolyspora aridisoli]
MDGEQIESHRCCGVSGIVGDRIRTDSVSWAGIAEEARFDARRGEAPVPMHHMIYNTRNNYPRSKT